MDQYKGDDPPVKGSDSPTEGYLGFLALAAQSRPLSVENTLAGIDAGTAMAKRRLPRKHHAAVDSISGEMRDGIRAGGRGGLHRDAWNAENFANSLVRAFKIVRRERSRGCEHRQRRAVGMGQRPRERRSTRRARTSARRSDSPSGESEPPPPPLERRARSYCSPASRWYASIRALEASVEGVRRNRGRA